MPTSLPSLANCAEPEEWVSAWSSCLPLRAVLAIRPPQGGGFQRQTAALPLGEFR